MTRKPFVFTLAAAVAVVAAFISTPAGSARSHAATNGRIAFQSSRPPGDSTATEIYTVDSGPNESNLSAPLSTGLYNGDPAWSPDGTQIAFGGVEFAAGLNCCGSIIVMAADGSDHRKVVNGNDVGSGFIGGAAWSPDGSKIAFHAGPDGNSHIWVAGADGSNPTQLTTGSQSDYFPAWSPDGTRIAFESNRAGGYDIYSMRASDGGDVQQLTSMDGPEELPAWSPDGSEIAFDNHPITGGHQIWLMNVDGSNQHEIFGSSLDNSTSAAWSPDGTKIAFVSDRDHDSHDKIWTIDADGKNPVRVTNPTGGSDDYPSWGGTGGGGGGGSDRTPPSIGITLTSPNQGVPDGKGGWFVTGPVGGTVTADDAGSGVATIGCGPVLVTTSGLGQSEATATFAISNDGLTHVSCTATDAAGNASSPATRDVRLDAHAPQIVDETPLGSGGCDLPGNFNWCRGTKTATFAVSDLVSGMQSPCTPSSGVVCRFNRTSSEQGGAVRISSGPVCDVAGNCAAALSSPFQIDSVAPTVVRHQALDSCSVPGFSGWCRGVRSAGFTFSDATSGGSLLHHCDPGASCDFLLSSSTQGAAVTITGSFCDEAGNCAATIDAGPYKIDSVPPTVPTVTYGSPIFLSGPKPFTQTGSVTDATSGVLSVAVSSSGTSPAGMHFDEIVVLDVAGNMVDQKYPYLVEYRPLGFIAPAAGSTVPHGQPVLVKFALTDYYLQRIPDAEARTLAGSCRVTVSVSGAQTQSPICASYNGSTKQFVAVWRAGNQTGNVTLRATVTYPGTSQTTALTGTAVVG